jgi:DNA-directed RNA polymerase subunit F
MSITQGRCDTEDISVSHLPSPQSYQLSQERCKMSISSATKSLAEDIEASYATRIAGVSDIVKETHQTLENFQRENKETANTLRNELSSSERDRRQEFSTFIGNIKDEVATIEKDTTQMLADFKHDHKEMADTLKNDLSSSERDRKQEFSTFIGNIREEVATTIAGIATDHQQAHTQWKNLSKTMAAKRARK